MAHCLTSKGVAGSKVPLSLSNEILSALLIDPASHGAPVGGVMLDGSPADANVGLAKIGGAWPPMSWPLPTGERTPVLYSITPPSFSHGKVVPRAPERLTAVDRTLALRPYDELDSSVGEAIRIGPMMSDNSDVAAKAEMAAIAAFQLNLALLSRLAEKGVLSLDEANEVAALAASACRGIGKEPSAKFIEASIPTYVGVDVVESARARGSRILRRDA